MVTIIKRGASKKRIENLLKKMRVKTGIDAFKYCGVIKLRKDASGIQKKLRDEWK